MTGRFYARVEAIGLACRMHGLLRFVRRPHVVVGSRSDHHDNPLQLWLALFGALLVGAMPCRARAELSEPADQLVVPFAAGGLTDVPARVFGDDVVRRRSARTSWSRTRPAASGTIGAPCVARRARRLHAARQFGRRCAEPSLRAGAVHPIDDFAQIGWIVDGPPLVLVIDAELPYKTLAELVADAKANPKKLSFGTSGPASSPAMALALLNALAKTEIVGVPYRGSGEAARAVTGGQIQGVFTFYSQAKPLADDGKLRALAVASPNGLPDWPDVPTFPELGYKIDFRGFVGLAAPAKTPKPVIEYLNKQLNAVVQTDLFKKRMASSACRCRPPPTTRRKSTKRYIREKSSSRARSPS